MNALFKRVIKVTGIIMAIYLIKDLLDNENNKIITKKGLIILEDIEKMKTLNTKIDENKKNPNSEIII